MFKFCLGRFRQLSTASALALISTFSVQAQDLSPKPLIDIINTPVGDVKTSDTIKLPMITWGGDMFTLNANGLSNTTQPGSIFDQAGLNIELVRQDDFKQQLREYISGETPFLRCTVGMCNQAVELLSQDPRTKPVVIWQMTWSHGGDGLVAKKGIIKTSHLKGKTISLQAYGPHVDFLTTILQQEKLSMKDVSINWQPDLTLSDDAPPAVFARDDIDAAFMVLPDALVLTTNRTVGTGRRGSTKGARMITSTMFAHRIIADVYVVRSDYLNANREQVGRFVKAMMASQTDTLSKMDNLNSAHRITMLEAAAGLLLDDSTAIGPMEDLFLDAEPVGLEGNIRFLQDDTFKYNLKHLNNNVQGALKDIGLIRDNHILSGEVWDYSKI